MAENSVFMVRDNAGYGRKTSRRNYLKLMPPNAVVTCKIKLFHKHFSLCRHPFKIIAFRMETCVKLFQNYFTGTLHTIVR